MLFSKLSSQPKHRICNFDVNIIATILIHCRSLESATSAISIFAAMFFQQRYYTFTLPKSNIDTKMMVFKIYFLSNMAIFGIHVGFGGACFCRIFEVF